MPPMSKMIKRSNKIRQTKAKILSNKRLVDDFYKVCLYAPQIAKQARPGQFLNVKVDNSYRPLLRKPLGIHRLGASKPRVNIEILYKAVGKGTQVLSQRHRGEYIDIIGPLGNGFDSIEHKLSSGRPILVAGGIGIGPLLFLAERLKERNGLVLIGARTKRHILCEKEFRALGCEVNIATEDGTKGFRGQVTELLKKILPAIDYRLSTIYACGPQPMLKAIACICRKASFSCFGLLEEYMACGTGACFGCVVDTQRGFKRVCQDGPVFDLSTIRW